MVWVKIISVKKPSYVFYVTGISKVRKLGNKTMVRCHIAFTFANLWYINISADGLVFAGFIRVVILFGYSFIDL